MTSKTARMASMCRCQINIVKRSQRSIEAVTVLPLLQYIWSEGDIYCEEEAEDLRTKLG